MKKKNIILCILSLLLALNITFVAAGEEVYTEGYFYYTISDKSITIVGYFGNETVVTVPSSIAGIPVNTIGPNAFVDTGVEIIYLPDTVRDIGEHGAGNAIVLHIGDPTPVPPSETPTAVITERPTLTPTAVPTTTTTTVPTPTVVPATPPATTSEVTPMAMPTAAPTERSEPTSALKTPEPALTDAPVSAEATMTVAPTSTESPVTIAPDPTGSTTATAEATALPVVPTVELTSEPSSSAGTVDASASLSWLWILLGAVAVLGVAGIVILAVSKAKKAKKK